MKKLFCDVCEKEITGYKIIPMLMFDNGKRVDSCRKVTKRFELCRDCADVVFDFIKTLGVKDAHQ